MYNPKFNYHELSRTSEEGKISVVRPGRDWEVLKVNDLNDPFFATPALFCFTAQ